VASGCDRRQGHEKDCDEEWGSRSSLRGHAPIMTDGSALSFQARHSGLGFGAV
jgi:hypothetical protein